jgi:hypothetical protein
MGQLFLPDAAGRTPNIDRTNPRLAPLHDIGRRTISPAESLGLRRPLVRRKRTQAGLFGLFYQSPPPLRSYIGISA